jgi:hypothetical protein
MKTITPICTIAFCLVFLIINLIMQVSISYWAVISISFAAITYYLGEVAPRNNVIRQYSVVSSSIMRISLAMSAIHFLSKDQGLLSILFVLLTIAWIILSSFILKKLDNIFPIAA